MERLARDRFYGRFASEDFRNGLGSVNLRPNIIATPGIHSQRLSRTAAAISARTRRSGVLMGKVGGKRHAVRHHGNYEGTPGREGKLYLQIVPSQYNTESTGGYQVKINAKQ